MQTNSANIPYDKMWVLLAGINVFFDSIDIFFNYI